MSVTVYGLDLSPIVRSTLLTIEALGLEIEFKEVNTLKGEQFTPEFLELNPLHTIPTIKDGDFVLWDSHAVNSYLVEKYGKDDSLYPKDIQKRGVVNQRLFYDCGVLFPRVGAILSTLVRQKEKSVRKDLADSLTEAYASLEKLLAKGNYMAGDQVTIADFSIVATLSSANVLVPVTSNEFPKVSEWFVNMQKLPYYAKGNAVGLEKFTGLIKNMLEEET